MDRRLSNPDSLAMLISAAALAISTAALVRPDKARRNPPELSMIAVCPCEHGINYHDKLTGRCRAKRERAIRFNLDGKPIKWDEVACDCQVYAGPELIRSLADLDRLGLTDAPKDDP
jgi:hypothetical protein